MITSEAKLTAAVNALYDRLEAEPLDPVWISLIPREKALARARELEGRSDLPLAGKTFAAKDNFDVAGVSTTAGCPAFSYSPTETATVVHKLEEAGALLIGKTNMDQFATGLVGTRTPYGACSSVFNEGYISGGSSSGSAVAVARRLVDFSLGTDTAGSGRVPAAFNGLIGMKPTRGLLSTKGVVPACRTLDCVSIFARSCVEARDVWMAAKGFDPGDPFSREPRPGEGAVPWVNTTFRFGVPPEDQLHFFRDDAAAELYRAAVRKLQELGGEKVEIDFTAFRKTAELLYGGPWVAERLAAIKTFFRHHADKLDATVRGIIGGAAKYVATDVFEANYRLCELRREAEQQWSHMDVLFLPTTGTIYTHEQIAADPVKLNTNLGYYTNFVNLMDLAALAVPGGLSSNGLPFGVSFIGRAFCDDALLVLAQRYLGEAGPLLGTPSHCVEVAVLGAHLSGQPLNYQLTKRNARLQQVTRTAADYRLFALNECTPPKPGLVREEGFGGPGIEVEIWAVPENMFGSFVREIPAPLTIGTVTLANGESVKCFLCEPYAIASAPDITHFGGWRAYLRASNS